MTGLLVLLAFVCFTCATGSSLQCSPATAWSSNSLPGSCDFENGTCGYLIRVPWNHTVSYKKDKWYTPIVATDGGHFVVMDRNSPFIDSYGRFVSPEIPAGDYCLTFRYYITYSSVRLLGNTSTGNIFCNLTEQSLETVAWKNMSVELHETTPFQLSFYSIHVQFEWYVYKDTSIVDDIILSQVVQTTPSPPTTTTTKAVIMSSNTEQCSHLSTTGSCPFNCISGACGYTIGPGWELHYSHYRWNHGRIYSYFDNDADNDTYYLVYGVSHPTEAHGIQSPCLPSGSYCLNMWYVFPSSDYHAEIFAGDTLLVTLQRAPHWKKVSLNFTAHDDFKLRIRVPASDHTVLMAFDDIELSSNIKDSTHVPSCASSTKFPSANYQTQTTSTIPPCVSTTGAPSSTRQPQGTLVDAIHHGCTINGWNITINMDLMKQLYPGISTNHIYFGDNSCQGTTIGSSLVFQQGFRDCITSERISGDKFMYENDLFYVIYDPIKPFVLRQHVWTYTVECDINRDDVTSSHVQHTASSHPNATATAHYGINLAFYKDANFMTQLSGNPVHIDVGDDLYTKVFTTVSDWSIKMRLHTCYTGSENAADKSPPYYLIKDGCEVDANTHIISQATHETRFVFQDFERLSNTEGLSVHCNATFCKSTDYTAGCLQTCLPAALHTIVGK